MTHVDAEYQYVSCAGVDVCKRSCSTAHCAVCVYTFSVCVSECHSVCAFTRA